MLRAQLLLLGTLAGCALGQPLPFSPQTDAAEAVRSTAKTLAASASFRDDSALAASERLGITKQSVDKLILGTEGKPATAANTADAADTLLRWRRLLDSRQDLPLLGGKLRELSVQHDRLAGRKDWSAIGGFPTTSAALSSRADTLATLEQRLEIEKKLLASALAKRDAARQSLEAAKATTTARASQAWGARATAGAGSKLEAALHDPLLLCRGELESLEAAIAVREKLVDLLAEMVAICRHRLENAPRGPSEATTETAALELDRSRLQSAAAADRVRADGLIRQAEHEAEAAQAAGGLAAARAKAAHEASARAQAENERRLAELQEDAARSLRELGEASLGRASSRMIRAETALHVQRELAGLDAKSARPEQLEGLPDAVRAERSILASRLQALAAEVQDVAQQKLAVTQKKAELANLTLPGNPALARDWTALVERERLVLDQHGKQLDERELALLETGTNLTASEEALARLDARLENQTGSAREGGAAVPRGGRH